MASIPRRIGVDVGGTFTDFVEVGEGGVRAWKRLSTPDAPERGVLDGLPAEPGQVVHGSTVATNALLERKGPRTALIVTEGFKDLLEIRRQVRTELYALEPRRTPHVVARGDAIPVRERMDFNGQAIVELTDAEIARVVAAAKASGAEAFAICFLHSYANPEHEARIAAALRNEGLRVCASHEVAPEYREYERGSTTAINAFLQETVEGYLARLADSVDSLRIMHSGAGLTSGGEAAERPVSMLLSGPAGGVLGALAVAKRAGFDRIITFDMGGTSTDVALCEGEPLLRNQAEIDGLVVRTPMVDVVTVGAGGGSIARIDTGGALLVGPQSAGAEPGPACYGKGTLPTVTDANLVLGRLYAGQGLGGSLQPEAERALAALATLGEAQQSATAVVDVVNANMARALRQVSLERGFDPGDFTLVAFGGAGPLHACELATEVGIPRVLVPRIPGVLSALGMLTAAEAIERGHAVLRELGTDEAVPEAGPLEAEAQAGFRALGFEAERTEWSADLRYRGQAHEIRVSVAAPDEALLRSAFETAHRRQFGYVIEDRPVELVTLRIRIEAQTPELPGDTADSKPIESAEPIDTTEAGPVWRREDLGPRLTVNGPAVVVQDDATTFIPSGWTATTDAHANLVLEQRP